jgi:hypothetical protein
VISHVLDSQVHWSFFLNIYHVNPVFGLPFVCLPTDSSSLVILRFFRVLGGNVVNRLTESVY